MQNKREIVKTQLMTYIKKLYKKDIKKLPAEEALTQKFEVSRVTIRAVLSELESEGIVLRRQGYGTFISDTVGQLDVQFNPVTSYDKMITEFGYQESSKILNTEVLPSMPADVAVKLGVSAKSQAVYTTKLFFADEKPCVYCIDYFPVSLLDSEADLKRIPEFPKSIFEFLSTVSNHTIVKDYTQISTELASADANLTRYFLDTKTKDKSFLELDCINYDRNNQPILFAKEYIDTKFIKFFSARKKQL